MTTKTLRDDDIADRKAGAEARGMVAPGNRLDGVPCQALFRTGLLDMVPAADNPPLPG
jgi:hypothetical protein